MANDVESTALTVEKTNLPVEEVVMDSQCPQPNLPLPRELRDHIYSYLLRDEHVRDKPYHTRPQNETSKVTKASPRDRSIAHTYKSHTAILAVNREINKEALEILKSNRFIVVSYKWPHFGDFRYHLGLPIVTEYQNSVARFNAHALRVHMEAPASVIKGLEQQNKQKVKIGSFLMVGNDLPEFCRVLSWGLCCTPITVPLITYVHGTPAHHYHAPHASSFKSWVVHTRIQFQLQNLPTETEPVAKKVLRPFGRIIWGGQKVTILNTGKISKEEVERFLNRMGLKSVWSNAMAWHVLGLAQDIRSTAEEVVKADSAKPSDTIISSDAMNLVGEFTNRLAAVVPYALPSDEALSLAFARASWHTFVTAFAVDRSESVLAGTLERLGLLEGYLSRDAYFKHDFELVKECARDKKRRTEYLNPHPGDFDSTILEATSACKLPIRVYSTPMPKNIKRPEGLDGFVDKVHFERIKAADPERAATLL